MEMTGNTILITGGGSGIGRGLAEAFHGLGNQVILAGRRKGLLESVTAANPGMQSAMVDVQDPASLRAFARSMVEQYPSLNVLVNNAGIMKPENLREGAEDLSAIEATVATNLIAPLQLTLALLPMLKEQRRATVMTVSSGLAFVPMAQTPTYCATKAAIHSWTQSLRYQLRGSSVEVLELIPPYVQTELMGAHQTEDPRAMPLRDFIDEVMEILRTRPEAKEICVKRVYPLRYAAEQGEYQEMFERMNGAMSHAE